MEYPNNNRQSPSANSSSSSSPPMPMPTSNSVEGNGQLLEGEEGGDKRTTILGKVN